jgi:glycerol-3-phosphate dehydrogenase
MISDIENTKEFDLVIIGGGATGSGAALDAAMRGLKVACFEREDFASGTSSRSTKLIWGGSRYLVQALVTLFSLDLRLIRRPRESIDAFMRDFRMVLNCHRERVFLLKQQPHLTNWLPIAVPLTSWLLWPPPFGHPAAILGPLGLFPVFFKFYDMLSGFESPPSHIMTRARVERKFPQLSIENLKYCSVFYEGQHDDARTNLTLAETAAVEGAKILNYMEVRATLPATGAAAGTNKVGGLLVRDRISGREYRVKSKVILSCCGPFANEIRNLANNTNAAPGAEPKRKQPALVKGAGGVHIVLPSYFAPRGLGMVDMSTSDGRFLFLLPWEGQVLVGTTDRKMNDINMKPVPTETEIRWLLKEASKYLNREEISVRRKGRLLLVHICVRLFLCL